MNPSPLLLVCLSRLRVFAYVFVRVPQGCSVQGDQKRAAESLQWEFHADGCKLPCEFWEPEPSPWKNSQCSNC